MRQISVPIRLALLLPCLLLGAALAQDEFDWLPPGGAGLLLSAVEGCESCGSLEDLLTAEREGEEWIDYFEQHGLHETLEPHEVATLAGYLALVAPIDASRVPEGSQVRPDQLPEDGRLLTLQQCMICHGIMRPVTQDWRPDRWLDFFGDGTHSTIGMPESEQRLIANFLGNNTVTVEQIPEGQRGNTPGY